MTLSRSSRQRDPGIVDHSSGRLTRAVALVKQLGPAEILRRIRQGGLSGSYAFIARNLRHQIAHARARAFDRKEGVDTSGSIQLDGLDVTGPNRALGNEAVSTSPKSFRWLLAQAPLPAGATFIDIGCGKGRTVLLASAKFGRSVGVEFARELVATARSNIASYRDRHPKAGEMRVVRKDAADFVFPPGPMVIYLYNPFDESLLRKVLANLKNSLSAAPRPCLLIYVTGKGTIAWATRSVAEMGALNEIKRGRVPAFSDAIRPLDFAIYAGGSAAS